MRHTIVVGVSGRTGSPGALRWAVEEAGHRGSTVVAVRAWRPSSPMASGARPPLQTYDVDSAHTAEEARLAADVAKVLGPDHSVECRLIHGGRRKVLVAAARAADLLVLDAPRPSDLSVGPMFAHRLVYAAPCPVVIMPPAMTRAAAASPEGA
ncbi:MAG: universal stress protein [Lapillicoccus sp.]